MSNLSIKCRIVHGSDGSAGRVGSRFCRYFGGSGRVSTSEFLVFLLIISGFQNQFNLI